MAERNSNNRNETKSESFKNKIFFSDDIFKSNFMFHWSQNIKIVETFIVVTFSL